MNDFRSGFSILILHLESLNIYTSTERMQRIEDDLTVAKSGNTSLDSKEPREFPEVALGW